MITLLKQDSFSKTLMLVGLETDTKPTEYFTFRGAVLPIRNGSTFYEADTATFYVYDGDSDTWIKQSGGGGYPEPTGTVQITQNGVGIDVKDYAEADVAVENSYTQADEGKVVDNGALVSQTSKNIGANGTVDTTKNNEVVVAVPNTYVAGDEGKVVENGSLVAQSSQSISANGTYDTTKKNEVVVNVSGGVDVDLVLSRTLTSIESGTITAVPEVAYQVSGALQRVDLPNCVSIGSFAFAGSTGDDQNHGVINYINLPACEQIGEYAFYMSIADPNNLMGELVLPHLEVSRAAFSECSSLKKVIFANPSDENSVVNLGRNAFSSCSSLESVDCNRVQLAGYVFSSCTSLTALIMRSTVFTSLTSTMNFKNTPIEGGTGYIYVPRSIKSTYEAATNWVTYASQFRALEDYTVDGTTTGALDPNKI